MVIRDKYRQANLDMVVITDEKTHTTVGVCYIIPLFLPPFHPDITVMVDWALKIQLSIYPPSISCLSQESSVSQSPSVSLSLSYRA